MARPPHDSSPSPSDRNSNRRESRSDGPRPERTFSRPAKRPPLRLFSTTLWEYPSQHYDSWVGEDGNVVRAARTMQGDKHYIGATPSWVIWQLLMRYTREQDVVVDPMCGSGTTLDVCTDLRRHGRGFDLNPQRPDIQLADARQLPIGNETVDFFFVDPPYSTHVDYSNDPRCIGKLDASPDADDGGHAYYRSMSQVIGEMHRVLKPRRYAALYVSDSWRKRKSGESGSGTGVFMPIGLELFAMMREKFRPVDIVSVVRNNAKLDKANWRKAAEEGNYFMRGFNYLFIVKKE